MTFAEAVEFYYKFHKLQCVAKSVADKNETSAAHKSGDIILDRRL